MKNVFDKKDAEEIEDRINSLNPDSKGLWGKMNVGQMLAHCNVTYEMAFEKKHTKPSGFKKFMLKLFVKSIVVSEKPYKKDSRTAPEFVKTSPEDFEMQRKRLVSYLQKTQELGKSHFENMESHSFGPLSGQEWNNMFYKHLDHHLKQFGK